MMDEKEKWVEEVFRSMKGSERAKPRPELFSRIEQRIARSKAIVISPHQWRQVAAAAIFILLTNVAAVLYYTQLEQVSQEDVAASDSYSGSLINSYQLYE